MEHSYRDSMADAFEAEAWMMSRRIRVLATQDKSRLQAGSEFERSIASLWWKDTIFLVPSSGFQRSISQRRGGAGFLKWKVGKTTAGSTPGVSINASRMRSPDGMLSAELLWPISAQFGCRRCASTSTLSSRKRSWSSELYARPRRKVLGRPHCPTRNRRFVRDFTGFTRRPREGKMTISLSERPFPEQRPAEYLDLPLTYSAMD